MVKFVRTIGKGGKFLFFLDFFSGKRSIRFGFTSPQHSTIMPGICPKSLCNKEKPNTKLSEILHTVIFENSLVFLY